ncbi:MAG: 50S ribosomal protein L20 [Candidatus Kapabacteria bacterium]|nr:50S ribosomal protein L20 [Candidatus Kapabacteria bacterium]MCS7170128.1 50S ribosomal protein L20 [Candidatus Kapabacteria bacterium]MDW8225155.1 50S ribosomal protein L20 [Bacteroidota bacterium]
MRTRNRVASRQRRKKVLKLAKGYWGARSKLLRQAKDHVAKALQYAYRDRRQRKRLFRALWIVRINAAARQEGTTYSRLMHVLQQKNIQLNRKLLAELAMNRPEVFREVVRTALHA